MTEPTIRDVAKTAGVSPSTVSNYVNGRLGKMLPDTRARIEEAIAQLDYRPNQAARQLRTRRQQAIGLIVPSVANPLWGSLAAHLGAIALERDVALRLWNSSRDPELEARFAKELADDGALGVVMSMGDPSLSHLAPLLARGLRMVAFDRVPLPDDPDGLYSVGVDNRAGGRLAARHLIDLGHRRAGVISASLRNTSRRHRLEAFSSEFIRAGLPEPAVWEAAQDEPYGDVEAAILGRDAARALLLRADAPTALFAANDMVAVGACQAIRDMGLRIAADVSVVGFDDVPFAGLYHPPLTSIRQPVEQLAGAAFDYVSTGRRLVEAGLQRPSLAVRESSGPPAHPVDRPLIL